MPAGLPVAILLFAQAAAPAEAGAPRPTAAEATPAKDGCSPPVPEPGKSEIVICAEKPQGYRLNPDVMKAKKQLRSGGRPTKPGPMTMTDNSCTVVGPAPCINAPMINLVAAALTAAEMAKRLAEGKEIGSMFVTDPHPSEYQLYLEAKREREAKEAEAQAKAAADKAKAEAAAAAPPAEQLQSK
jgi:hypothetical protein